MEERTISIRGIVRDLMKNILLIILGAVTIALIGHILVKQLHKPSYVTTMSYVVSPTDASVTDMQIKNNLTNTFKQVIDSSVLKKSILQEMKVDELPGTIESSVVTRTKIQGTQQVEENTSIILITVKAQNPWDSFRMACGVRDNCRTVSDYVNEKATLTLLENPTMPTEDSTAVNYIKQDLIVFVGALIVLCGIVAVFSTMRDTVKSSEEVREKLGLHLLSAVPDISVKGRQKQGILVTDEKTGFYFTENVKKICSKLEGSKKDKQGLCVALTSYESGEGRSTFAVNMAICFAMKGSNTLLVDLDFRKPSVYRLMGIEPKNQFTDFINGKVSLSETIIKDDKLPLTIACQRDICENSPQIISSDNMAKFIQHAKEKYDYIVFDTSPASVCADMETLSGLVETAVIVVRQDTARSEDINALIDSLTVNNCNVAGCIYNADTRNIKENNGYGYGYGYGYGRYGKYGHYGKYGKYGGYGNYGGYGGYGGYEKTSSGNDNSTKE